MFRVILIVLLVTFSTAINGKFVPTHSAVLDEDNYYLYWLYTKETITFEVQAKTTGYVGFGISPNGGMANSDIVIGWVKDGQKYFKDRFATGKSTPVVDTSQDWTLVTASDNGTWTSLRFTRKLKTCDTKQDIDITESTARVIWSYHTADPASETGTLPQHTKRGTKSLQLLSYGAGLLKTPTIPDDAIYFDILQPNVSVPSDDTTYYCAGFKIPEYSQKHHVIKMEPVIQKGHETLVHHILVYACYKPVNDSLHGFHGVCQNKNMPKEFNCISTMFAWAIGGGAFYFPEHTGYPLGAEDSPKFLIIETHFDNPNKRSDYVDASGFRLTLTTKLRQYDAAILANGHAVTHGEIIPPGVANFKTVGICPSQCTSQAMASQPQGVKIFYALLHSHLLGRKIHVRHIRNGIELPLISFDNEYDFNYQEGRILEKEVTLLPGDEIRTECVTDSTARTSLTLGGRSTREEMCLSFLMFYPAIDLTRCLSSPIPKYLINIAVSDASNINITTGNIMNLHKLHVLGPPQYAGQSLYQLYNSSVNWKDDVTVRKFEKLLATSYHQADCKMPGRIHYPVEIFMPSNITKPLPMENNDLCTATTSGVSAFMAQSIAYIFMTVFLVLFR